MSQRCHEATRTEAFAPAFRAGGFPGFPKKSPPCRQWIGNENPRRDLGARERRSPLRRRMSRIAKGPLSDPLFKNKRERLRASLKEDRELPASLRMRIDRLRQLERRSQPFERPDSLVAVSRLQQRNSL
jgi:hypothetical protein